MKGRKTQMSGKETVHSNAVAEMVWKYSPSSGTNLLILLYLARCHNQDTGGCYPSIATIATNCRVNERQVQKILKELEQDGEIEIAYFEGAKTKQGATNFYRLTRYVNVFLSNNKPMPLAKRKGVSPVTPVGVSCITPVGVSSVTPEPKELDLKKNNLKDMQATPNGVDLRSAPDMSLEAPTPLTSSSKKKGKEQNQEQPPTPPNSAPPPPSPKERAPRVQVTTTPPTTHDSADSPKPPRALSDYQRITGAVKQFIFGLSEQEPNMKRVGLIAGYLWGSNKSMQAPRPANEDASQKADNIIADIEAFTAWWGGEFRDAHPPIDLDKFWGWWLKFWHNKRKAYYNPVTATQYVGVAWNDYGDTFGDDSE